MDRCITPTLSFFYTGKAVKKGLYCKKEWQTSPFSDTTYHETQLKSFLCGSHFPPTYTGANKKNNPAKLNEFQCLCKWAEDNILCI